MRIGIFSMTYLPNLNGVATSIHILKKHLELHGHEVYVVTVNDKLTSYDWDAKEKILRVPSFPVKLYDYRFSAPYHVRAVKIIKAWNLDVIHCQTEEGIGMFARSISKRNKIPLLHTYHTDYEEYIHHMAKGKLDPIAKHAIKPFVKYYCDRSVTELIVPSEKTYTLFKERYRFDRNIHIVPNGIEIERFFTENVDLKEVEQLKKQYGLTKKDFVYLYLGRIGKEKGIETLIEITNKVVPKNKNFKLVIVGGIDGPAYPALVRLVKKYKLENHVIFTDKAPFEKTQVYYHMADAFAMASKFETQGLTVIEAMASSVVPICINDPAFNKTVVNGLNGFLFEDVNEAVEILLEISKNKKQLEQMKKQARLTANEHDAHNFANKIEKVYEIAIQNYQPKKRWFKK